jgi:hypothetical protein
MLEDDNRQPIDDEEYIVLAHVANCTQRGSEQTCSEEFLK